MILDKEKVKVYGGIVLSGFILLSFTALVSDLIRGPETVLFVIVVWGSALITWTVVSIASRFINYLYLKYLKVKLKKVIPKFISKSPKRKDKRRFFNSRLSKRLYDDFLLPPSPFQASEGHSPPSLL